MDRRSFFFTLLAVPIAAAVASAQQPARGGFVPDTRYLVGETPCETILPAGLVKRMEDGRSVEIGAIGTEGLAGLRSLYGIERAIWDSIVKIDGDAFRVDQQWLQGELTRNKELRELLKRCHFLSVSQLAQTAACNRLHPLRQRCCSWLLLAHDSARSDSFKFTHEFLGMMLGVQRVRVTIMVKNLQKDGIIRYTRAKMIIANRSALESSACECYRTIRKQSDQLLGLSES